MSSKEAGTSTTVSATSSDKVSKPSKSSGVPMSKTTKVPKLALDTPAEDEKKTRNVAPLLRSVSQMLPSELLPRGVYATITARGAPAKRIGTPAAQPGATASATFSVRVFITSDLTPHRFCALVIKQGWQWDDFLEAASAKLSGGNTVTPGLSGQNLTAASAVFLSTGAEIGALDDLREDDQVLLRFQKRLSVVPTKQSSNSVLAVSKDSVEAAPTPSETPEDGLISYIPMDGVFRVLLPELIDISPLTFSEELVADLVQDELKQLSSATPIAYNATKLPDTLPLRILMRDLVSTELLADAFLRTYDYVVPHHTFLSILIVHLRAPLVPMELAQSSANNSGPVRPQPPQGRSASALPMYGMSVQMTDPIRRGNAQTRIVNVIKQWIECRFDTIRDDLATLELIDDLIVFLCASPDRLRAYGEGIARTFKSARRVFNQRERNLELCYQQPISKEKLPYTRAVEVSPFELATQLTLADQDIFLKVNLAELQAQQFDLTERNLSPHIIEWVKHSTYITSWVVASILGPPGEANPGPKQRALVLQHFLTAMDELRSMRSYNAMMQIYHALTHPAIDRLEMTWESVSPAHLAIKTSISDMVKPPSAQGYHNLIQIADAPAIPYIEYHLNELRHIETLETITAEGDVNLAKFERLSKAFRSVMRLQATAFDLIPNPAYMSFIRTYEVPPMSTLVELSLAIESDVVNASAGSTGASSSASGRIVVRPAARSISDARTASSPGSSTSSVAPGSGHISHASTGGSMLPSDPVHKSGKFGSLKERKRKDSSAQKVAKEKEKEEEKRKKKWDKQAKKIKPLLTAALSIEQAILNNDIYDQFLSYSNDTVFLNALIFYKSVAEFKRMFGSDVEPAARRTREEASRIAITHLAAGAEKIPEFSSNVDSQIKDIESRAKAESGIFTNNIFDPLTADLIKMLSTSFVLFKAQRTA